jgi:hypothetical protein
MGIITILCGLAFVVLGAGSLITRRSMLPELEPGEAALTTLPFGVIVVVIGIIIQSA